VDDVTEYGVRRILIVLGIMAATLMQTLDSTIANVALPTIQGNLGASQDQGTWVVTAYTIAAIIVIPLTPWLQARFGRKYYYITSIVGFTLASVACGESTSFSFLVFARVVQGAFGGGLLATGQSLLRDTFPPKQLGLSQGIFTIGAVMGPALGPPLGGILVDNYSWNWCFDINVVPGLFASVILFIMLRDPKKAQALPLDRVGLLLLALGLSTMQYVLTEGEQHYWLQDPIITLAIIVCFCSLTAFVLYEIYGSKSPVVDMTILKNRSVSAGSVLAFAIGAAALGATYALPQFTQGPLGFTPTLSGLLFILRAAPIALCTLPIVWLVTKVDPRILLGMGFAVVAFANIMQSQVMTLETGFWTMAVALFLSGGGVALSFIPLTVSVLGATTKSEGPKASAFTNLANQLGGSVAVAVLDVLLHQRQEFHSSALAANVTLANPAIRNFLATQPIGVLAQQLYLQTDILSYADVTLAIGVVTALAIPLVILLRKPKSAEGPIEIELGG
jgi:MFS transporter, DHA2 family, multidrug resistance protein